MKFWIKRLRNPRGEEVFYLRSQPWHWGIKNESGENKWVFVKITEWKKKENEGEKKSQYKLVICWIVKYSWVTSIK